MPSDIVAPPRRASWIHLGVRPLVRPLIRLGVRPNHVTWAHLLLGLATLAALAWGSWEARLAAGFGWLVSCVLDRLDGEIARIGNMCSAAGHRLDYLTDMWLAALYFVALGLSTHAMPGGGWLALAGLVAGASQFVNGLVAERYDQLAGSNSSMLAGRWGFDADDALLLLGPLCWMPDVVRGGAAALAAIVIAGYLVLFVTRLRRLRRAVA